MYTTRFVDTPAGRLAYVDAGPSDGTAPAVPLLLVHGWAGDKALWWAALDRLAADHRCLAPDLPGHGESPLARVGLAPANLGWTLAAFLAALDVERAVVVGHSYGCFVGLHLALAQPERVAGLVLSNPPHPERGVWSARPWVGTRWETPTLSAARRVNAWLGRDAPARRWPGMAAFSRGRWRAAGRIPLPVLSATLRGIYQPGLTGRLGAMRAPTLVAAGRWDLTAPPSGARALADAIPGATLHLFPRASHHPMAESPDAFAEVVRALAGRLSSAAPPTAPR